MKIAFLHTAQIHVETFETLIKSLASDVECIHHVAPELLARAQAFELPDVAYEATEILTELSKADAVLCTCSTLGPLADDLAVTHPNLIRVDRPLMEAACSTGRNILVAICLESTRSATLALLQECAEQNRKTVTPRLVVCDAAWPYFETGDTAGFATEISRSIRAEIAEFGAPDCIVLAQASMRVAAPKLEDLGLSVLSSPLLAAKAILAAATSSSERSST